jgi:F-type H+-transporting ATPase subunit delta
MANRLENGKIAARYARALFESTVASGDVDKVAEDLNAIADVLSRVPEFTGFIENPVVPIAEKARLMKERFTASSSPWVVRLLQLLVENKRMLVFPQLVAHFNQLLNQRDNVSQAEVITAVELETELRARIQKTLETAFGFRRVELQHRVDPGLLGGMIVKLQDKVIDGSYMGRLEALRKHVGKG